MVGDGRAGDNGFPQAEIGIDYRLASLASEWVGREENASALCHDHALYNNRHAHGARIDAQDAAVAHSALGPQRRPAALDSREHGLDPNDIEVCFLLTGKARGRKVFSGGG